MEEKPRDSPYDQTQEHCVPKSLQQTQQNVSDVGPPDEEKNQVERIRSECHAER